MMSYYDKRLKFFPRDVVAMVSPKSGLVKYGVIGQSHVYPFEIDVTSFNKVNVIWHPLRTERLMLDDTLVLMNRHLNIGDVVRKVNDGNLRKLGYCVNVNVYATVKILNTNKIIENVSCQSFTPTLPFDPDTPVAYESWAGDVFKVYSDITFASQDGSIFTFDYTPPRIDDFQHEQFIRFPCTVIYVGRKLKLGLATIKRAKFISKSDLMCDLLEKQNENNKMKLSPKESSNRKSTDLKIEVYVKDITVRSVEVHWYDRNKQGSPRSDMFGDDLKKLKSLDFLRSRPTELGDIYQYTIKKNDNLISMKQWRSKCSKDFEKLLNTKKHEMNGKQNVSDPDFKSREMRKTVQDFFLQKRLDLVKKIKMAKPKPSTRTKGNGPILKLKSIRLKRNRMGKSLVRESREKRKPLHIPEVSTEINSTVDVKIYFTKSVIDVIWQDGTKESGIPSTDFYPVNKLHESELFPGTFVEEKNTTVYNKYGVIEYLRHAERTARVQWFELHSENPLPVPVENADFSLYDILKYNEFNFKFGSLVKYSVCPGTNPGLNIGKVLYSETNGQILVMGVNGEKTRYWPHELNTVKLVHINRTGNSFQLEIYNKTSNKWMSISGHSQKEGVDQGIFQEIPKLIDQNTSKNGDVKFESQFTTLLNTIKYEKHRFKFIEQVSESLAIIKMGLILIPFNPEQIMLLKDANNLLERCYASIEKMCSKDYHEWKNEWKYELNTSNEPEKNFRDKFIELVLEFKDKMKQINTKTSENGEQMVLELGIQPVYLVGPPEGIPLESPKIGFKPLKDLLEPYPVGNNTVFVDNNTECEDIARPEEAGVFEMVETLGYSSHKYANESFDAPPNMLKTVTKDIQILQKSLPAGIWVKTFEDRMDLFSVMIRGPESTPYTGGLFIFDVKLPNNYPAQPPFCHYYSFCDSRLNPNLYEDGKVCLSLLGTWAGDSVERWSPKYSNLLQLLVSIQGLILVSEPYFNEPGVHNMIGINKENCRSREYNEITLINVVHSMTKMLKMMDNTNFKNEIMEHITTYGPKLINDIENWIKLSGRELSEDEKLYPGYRLLPLTEGCCLSMKRALKVFKDILTSMNITFE